MALTLPTIVVTIAIAAAAPAPASSRAAQVHLDFTLQRLVDQARQHNPAIEAARQRWQAARHRANGEGLLPDPMIGAQMMSLNTFQGPQVTASQTFPLGGKLGLARRLAEQEAEAARLAYLAEVNRVAAEVRAAYYDALFQKRATAIVARTKDLMTRMSRIAATKYAVGTGKQGDPLRANVQVAEMLHEGVQLRQQAHATATRLRGLVAPEGEPLPALTADLALTTPLPTSPALEAALAAAEARNPVIGEARAMVPAGETLVETAKTVATPDLSAQLGIGRSYMDMGWMTALSGMVGVNVPFPNGHTRQEAAVAGAEAELAARRAPLADRRRQVRVAIEETLGHLGHYAEQVRLYQHGILPQARQALEAELANYQTNRSDFDAWLAAQVTLYRYEREAYEAIAEYHKMHAELQALMGTALAGLEDVR